MPQYALIGRHEANGCPLTSKAAREAAKRAYGALDGSLKQKDAKLLLDIHLDPSHKAFMLFEAPSAEAVRDIVAESGLISFLELDFHLVTPIPQQLQMAEKIPTIYPERTALFPPYAPTPAEPGRASKFGARAAAIAFIAIF